MSRSNGMGTRYDKFTPNAIDQAKAASSGVGVFLNYRPIFCVKCQKNKPREGHTKRAGMLFCRECAA